jgi:phosphate transport system protein
MFKANSELFLERAMNHFTDGHTVRRFDGELNELHQLVVEMGRAVLVQVDLALAALGNRMPDAVDQLTHGEERIDQFEKMIDNQVVRLLAQRTPLARDLRTVIAFSKVVTDLERIGDEALRIATVVRVLFDDRHPAPSDELLRDSLRTGHLTRELFTEGLEIMATLDLHHAERYLDDHPQRDFRIGFEAGFRRLTTFIMEDHRHIGHAMQIVVLCKALERIGEHACNLAEYVIYMVRGEDVRHRDGDGDGGDASPECGGSRGDRSIDPQGESATEHDCCSSDVDKSHIHDA